MDLDEVFDRALRIHDEYRAGIASMIQPLTYDEIELLLKHFGARNLKNLDPHAGLVAHDIRIACKRETKRRAAAEAAIPQETGS